MYSMIVSNRTELDNAFINSEYDNVQDLIEAAFPNTRVVIKPVSTCDKLPRLAPLSSFFDDASCDEGPMRPDRGDAIMGLNTYYCLFSSNDDVSSHVRKSMYTGIMMGCFFSEFNNLSFLIDEKKFASREGICDEIDNIFRINKISFIFIPRTSTWIGMYTDSKNNRFRFEVCLLYHNEKYRLVFECIDSDANLLVYKQLCSLGKVKDASVQEHEHVPEPDASGQKREHEPETQTSDLET